MKKAVIIEDEVIAVQNLMRLLAEITPTMEVVTIMQTIDESVAYFNSKPNIDVVFMDIHLADGLAFHIFEQTEISCPIIFTTAYDKYALEAFKVNSVDYLMKPIKRTDLQHALEKINHLSNSNIIDLNASTMAGLMAMMKNMGTKYKVNFLIPHGEKLLPLAVKEIACFYISTKITHAITFDGKTFALDKSLDEIIKQLDPNEFYRANRQFIIAHKAITEINVWFGSKLAISLSINTPERIIIPKAKTNEFKDWYTK